MFSTTRQAALKIGVPQSLFFQLVDIIAMEAPADPARARRVPGASIGEVVDPTAPQTGTGRTS